MTATPAEKKALLFLAVVVVLGAGTRLAMSLHTGGGDNADSREALRTQITAVDAARARDTRTAAPASRATSARPTSAAKPKATGRATTRVTTPADRVPPANPLYPYDASQTANGFISAPAPSTRGAVTSATSTGARIIDVDVASAAELESLPRIGPALAQRIIANRDSLGPFGSFEGLQRVKGIGPALAKLLAPLVTFSGTSRQLTAAARWPLAPRTARSTRARALARFTADALPPPASTDSRRPLRITAMAVPMAASADPIGELLVSEGLITAEQLQKGISEAKQNNARLGSALVKLGFIQEPDLTRALARQYRMPAVDLSMFEPDAKVLKLLPGDLATKHFCFPLMREGRSLTIAVVDPANLAFLEDLQFMTSYAITPVLAGELSIRKLIEKHYESTELALQSIFDDVLAEGDATQVEIVEQTQEESALSDQMDEAPVVRLINAILIDAVNKGASDIHFECFEHEVRVRYRIDGALNEVMKPPPRMRAALISRFKIMAQLNIAERRVPQDGRIKMKIGNRVLDFRMSTLPTLFGEKVVLRILDQGNLTLDLETFGIEPVPEKQLMEAISNPYGMVLVTGPTGSGKTTTLYSALSKINSVDTNIMTAEDPVEYNLFGINQVQVRSEIGMTFAASLRAFLRQDPNVIMVGEIRDLETGSIAIKAALTGHLVLSTLHTNSAAETVTRLLDMGLEPFNVASALNLVLAQRLVRRICSGCKERYQPTTEELIAMKVTASTTLEELRFTAEPLRLARGRASAEAVPLLANLSPATKIGELPFFRGKGCDRCAGGGLKGRQGLYEVMTMSPAIRRLVMQNGDAVDIRDMAVSEGMLTLRMDGWLKVLKGITTLEQVLRETAA